MFDTITTGAIVKVDGIRNKRYPYREVIEIDRKYRHFTGRQCAFDRAGNIVYGSEYPRHMANKIREIRDTN